MHARDLDYIGLGAVGRSSPCTGRAMVIGICRPKAGVNGLSSGDQVFYGAAQGELNYSEIGSSTYYVQVWSHEVVSCSPQEGLFTALHGNQAVIVELLLFRLFIS